MANMTEVTAAPDAAAWQSLHYSAGAVLIGGLVALFLSGAIFMQVILYFRMYTTDTKKTKGLVMVIWVLDITHSAMVMIANWQNLLAEFGNFDSVDQLPWSIALTVILTATTTFLVHCFFSYRIHTLSCGRWIITGPLYALAFVRLASATVSTVEMLRLKSFSAFVAKCSWVFSLGLGTSSVLDVLITIILCYFLRQRKSGLASMDRVITMLTFYTIENGMLTCITTAVALICWITMPHNLIFLGLHLAISKLYANSFLASLNARRTLSSRTHGFAGQEYPLPVLLPSPFSPHEPRAPWSPGGRQISAQKSVRVNVEIEQTVHTEMYGDAQETDLGEMSPDGVGKQA
ncbi:hypothetical protein C8Q77DRAFT_9997 [Trametes polyzona]|nr:hypothetical protein C8Q77DRAFT_9997 [Trametes polyzona]